jgi:hypothetical protein
MEIGILCYKHIGRDAESALIWICRLFCPRKTVRLQERQICHRRRHSMKKTLSTMDKNRFLILYGKLSDNVANDVKNNIMKYALRIYTRYPRNMWSESIKRKGCVKPCSEGHHWQNRPLWAIAFLTIFCHACLFRRELDHPVFNFMDFCKAVGLASNRQPGGLGPCIFISPSDWVS